MAEPTTSDARGEGSASDEPQSSGGPKGRSSTMITVTQTKSAIGSKPKQRGMLRALGLGRIGKTNTLPDRPEIRGMVAKVPHLIKVEEV